ncbi:hypothetical protein Tco_0685621 [Tanacetum coccineum]
MDSPSESKNFPNSQYKWSYILTFKKTILPLSVAFQWLPHLLSCGCMQSTCVLSSASSLQLLDKRAQARTLAHEIEARMSREAWGRSMDASDLACSEVMALPTQVVAQEQRSRECGLWASDRKETTTFDRGPLI